MIKVLEAIIFRRLLFWSISLKNNVNIVCGWWLGWFAGNQDDESWCNDSIVAGVKRSPCQVYQTDLNMRCSHHQYFDDKLNTSLLQTMTSTTEDMMETLDGTEMKFNDTDQRVNRKILNIFRATKDPNFLMKSFQSNGSFQQVLPSEGNRIFNFIYFKESFSFFRGGQISNISSALLRADLLRVCHSSRKYFNILACLHRSTLN